MRARTDQESVTALGFWRQNRKHFIFDLFLSKIESSVFATSRTKLAHCIFGALPTRFSPKNPLPTGLTVVSNH
jgi:hypothetical protein